MAITVTSTDSIRIFTDGQIEVSGKATDGDGFLRNFSTVLSPGDALDAVKNDTFKAQIQSYWTSEIIAAWQDRQSSMT